MDLFRETRTFGLSLAQRGERLKLKDDYNSNQPVLYLNRLQGI